MSKANFLHLNSDGSICEGNNLQKKKEPREIPSHQHLIKSGDPVKKKDPVRRGPSFPKVNFEYLQHHEGYLVKFKKFLFWKIKKRWEIKMFPRGEFFIKVNATPKNLQKLKDIMSDDFDGISPEGFRIVPIKKKNFI